MSALDYLRNMRRIPRGLSNDTIREVYENLPRTRRGFRTRIDAIISESAKVIGEKFLSSNKKEEIIDIGISTAMIKQRIHEIGLSQQDIENIKNHLKKIYLEILNRDKAKDILNEIIMRLYIERDEELSRLLKG